MTSHRFRLVLLIAVAALVLGVATTTALAAGGPGNHGTPFVNAPPSCDLPALPGTIVNVTLTDMPGTMMGLGTMFPGMMGGPRTMGPGPGGQFGRGGIRSRIPMAGMPMMSILIDPTTVPAGPVSFRVINAGVWIHELVVLPLSDGQSPGQRPIGADNEVDESASLGEATPCGGGDTHYIVPGGTGWTTITLAPRRYELICNIAGHYWGGMYALFAVTG